LKKERKAVWTKHLAGRVGFLLLGTVMFVGSYGLVMTGLTRLLLALGTERFGSEMVNSVPTIHRSMCLTMPITWAIYAPVRFVASTVGNPLYALVFVLIAASFFVGPLFCGWLCPAGGLIEHLSRLVPARLKYGLQGKIDPAPLRYGFLAGWILVAAPIWRGTQITSICCSNCNFTWTENIWNAAFGDFYGFIGLSSAGLITFALWFLVLGIFIKGGRGWCIFLCPAGALMNISHFLGKHLSFTRKLKVKKEKCTFCGICVKECPTLALKINEKSEKTLNINYHVCNICLDCVKLCPMEALEYSKIC